MPCAGGSATVDGLRLPRSARPEKQQSSTTITDEARQEVSVVGARTDEQHPDAEPGQRGHGCTPTPSGSPLVSSEEAAAEAFSALAASATASPSARSHTRFNSSDATPHAHNGFARRLKAQKAPARPPWGRGRGLRVPHAE